MENTSSVKLLNINIMKKNIRDYKKVGVQFAYVLDCVEHENTTLELSDKERIEYFFTRFDKEYNTEYEKRLYPNLIDRVAEYLKGLPSCIGIAFSNYDIEQIGKSWGYCKTDKQAAKFVYNWFNGIAFRLVQLKKYYNI